MAASRIQPSLRVRGQKNPKQIEIRFIRFAGGVPQQMFFFRQRAFNFARTAMDVFSRFFVRYVARTPNSLSARHTNTQPTCSLKISRTALLSGYVSLSLPSSDVVPTAMVQWQMINA